MENNLYYTPTIEEFYVGFEYEVLALPGDEWVKVKLTKDNFYLNTDRVLNHIDQCKVKYLDQSDIESLGWRFEKDIYRLNDYNLHFNKVLTITKEFILNNMKLCMTTIFEGNIKNKSELIKLMQQLNIK